MASCHSRGRGHAKSPATRAEGTRVLTSPCGWNIAGRPRRPGGRPPAPSGPPARHGEGAGTSRVQCHCSHCIWSLGTTCTFCGVQCHAILPRHTTIRWRPAHPISAQIVPPNRAQTRYGCTVGATRCRVTACPPLPGSWVTWTLGGRSNVISRAVSAGSCGIRPAPTPRASSSSRRR